MVGTVESELRAAQQLSPEGRDSEFFYSFGPIRLVFDPKFTNLGVLELYSSDPAHADLIEELNARFGNGQVKSDQEYLVVFSGDEEAGQTPRFVVVSGTDGGSEGSVVSLHATGGEGNDLWTKVQHPPSSRLEVRRWDPATVDPNLFVRGRGGDHVFDDTSPTNPVGHLHRTGLDLAPILGSSISTFGYLKVHNVGVQRIAFEVIEVSPNR